MTASAIWRKVFTVCLIRTKTRIYKDKGPFVINDGYGIYTVGVAKNLTQTQKARVSAVLYPMLQEAWFAEKPQYANYQISAILRRN